ncbi:MAG: hypothetical protein PHC51_12910, partial [bacterium]|nr:hypothetical protein [bacterium]
MVGIPKHLLSRFPARKQRHLVTLMAILTISLFYISSVSTVFAQCPNTTPIAAPILDNFESGQGYWTSGGTNNSWEFGTPTTLPPSNNKSVFSWVNGGVSDTYNANEYSYVLSPCYDLSATTTPRIEMSLWRRNYNNSDGLIIQYSLDEGVSWTTIGDYESGTNWYNDLNISWWSGNSKNWEQVSHDLPDLAGQNNVRFRILFSSDSYSATNGSAFDNFKLSDHLAHDLEVGDALLGTEAFAGSYICQNAAQYFPKITIRNTGVTAESGFQVWYQVDSNPIIYEPFSGLLSPGGTKTHKFTTGFDVNTLGNHTVSYGVDLVGDLNNTNNSYDKSVTIYPPLTPGLETFESGTGYWGTGGKNNSWAFGTPTKSPFSAASGNNAWVSGGLSGSYNNNELSWVESPCYNLGSMTGAQIKLSTFIDTGTSLGQSDDGLVLQSSTDNGQTWSRVGAAGSGSNWYDNSTEQMWSKTTSTWQTSEYPISNLAGQNNVKFRLKFLSDGSYPAKGPAFDNFEIVEPLAHDLTISGAYFGASGTAGNLMCQSINLFKPSVTFKNIGSNTESGYQVWYQIDGGAKISEAHGGSLAPLASVTHTFTNGITRSASGSHSITYGVDLAADLDTANNSNNTSLTIYSPITPTLETFESGTGYWGTGGTNNTWAFGTPAKTLNTAASGVNAWVGGGLQGTYARSESSWVESPCYDLSSLSLPYVQMSLAYDIYSGSDYLVLESSTDQGVTWSRVGYYGHGTNWYNKGYYSYWNDKSNGWLKAEHEIPSLAGLNSVSFRFRFWSYTYAQREGAAFDDFVIYQPEQHDLGITKALFGDSDSTGTSICQNNNFFKPGLVIRNNSRSTESGFQVWYKVDSGPKVYETFTGSIAPLSEETYIFSSGINRSIVGSHVIAYGVELVGDSNTNNNSGSTIVSIKPTLQFPYANDFEVNWNDWSTAGSLNTWSPGVVTKNNIVKAYNGVNAWTTGGLGAGERAPLENSWVLTPCFDMSLAKNPSVQFAYNRQLNYNDKVSFEYSVDDGNNWTKVGRYGGGRNWYNNSGQYWSSTSDAWSNAEYPMAELASKSNVRFRFHLEASSSTGYEGFAFDAFSLTESQEPIQVSQLDRTFADNGIWTFIRYSNALAKDLGVKSDGTIYVGGTYNSTSSSPSALVWYLDKNSTLRPEVGPTSWSGVVFMDGTAANGNSLLLDHNGDIVLAGNSKSGSYQTPTMWRTIDNGIQDGMFGNYGVSRTTFTGVDVQAQAVVEDTVNGGYYLTGGQNHAYMVITKLNSTGGAETGFNTTGKVTFNAIPTSRGNGVTVDPAGRIIVVGEGNPDSGDSDVIVWRYLSNGTLDTTFNGTGYLILDSGAGVVGANDYAERVVIDSSGNLLVAGYSSNGIDNDAVIWKVLGSSGTLDTSWQTSGHRHFANLAGAVGSDAFHDLQIDSVGNIWLAGEGINSTANSDMCVVKLLSSGNLDAAFADGGIYCHDNAAGGNGNDKGYGIFIDSKNEVYVAGESLGPYYIQATVWKIKNLTYSISGTVTSGGVPLSGVIIDGKQLGTQITDASGNYHFNYIPIGINYQIIPAKPGYAFTPKTISGALNANLTANFTGAVSTSKFSLSGHVYDGETPLAGVTIDGGALGSKITDNNGSYSFNNITIGTPWTLHASAPRTSFIPLQPHGSMVENITQDFHISVHDITVADVRIENINSPYGDKCSYGLAPTTIDVDLFNWGNEPQTGFSVKYQLDSGSWVSEVFTDTIYPGETANFIFSNPVDVTLPGFHSLFIDTSISAANSSQYVEFHTARTLAIPYGTNFENGSNNWINDDSWNEPMSLGTPAKSVINGAYSGSNAWVTNGLSPTAIDNYSIVSTLAGPCFDLSAAVDPEFSMQIWWSTKNFQDGAIVQVSIDDGYTWNILGNTQTGENWYNNYNITRLPNYPKYYGWSGSGTSGSGGWVKARHPLTDYIGQSSVRFRLYYTGVRNTDNDGIAIDDIVISERQSAPSVPNNILD